MTNYLILLGVIQGFIIGYLWAERLDRSKTLQALEQERENFHKACASLQKVHNDQAEALIRLTETVNKHEMMLNGSLLRANGSGRPTAQRT